MVVAFATLRGASPGAVATIGSGVLLIAVVVGFAGLSVKSIAVLVLLGWIPSAIAAEVLRRFSSLPLAIGTIALCSVVTVLGLFVLQTTLQGFWSTAIEGLRAVMATDADLSGFTAAGGEPVTDQQLISLLQIGAGITVLVISCAGLFLGRSGQARLFNPGGFQAEFHALYFGKQAALLCLVLVLIGFVISGSLGIGLATIALFPLLLQGLAVIHALVKERSLGVGWLVGLYGLLMFVQPITMLIGGIGLFDNLKRLPRH